MEDPLWRCMDSNKCLTRDQLELVIQKKKINEIFAWFQSHFVESTHAEYMGRCPIVVFQGPTGCGKTSTLKWISDQLKIPIKEYSETTDTTAINTDISKSLVVDENSTLTQTINRRKAMVFEYFVINSIRFNTLYPVNKELANDDAESEFDNDDGFASNPFPTSINPPKVNGVIIHIETPLSFARSQRILAHSLYRLLKIIRDVSKQSLRRIAIVFETLEGECETISLPSKIKQSLGIRVYKFNPITRSNMKKLVDSLVKHFNHIVFDKETIEQLVGDCDGDVRACVNTLHLICNRIRDFGNKDKSFRYFGSAIMQSNLPTNKKQKLNHPKVRQAKLNPSLMRDYTRSPGFFHVLGKIFYQKRLYPNASSDQKQKSLRSIDRPYQTENSTEYLVNMLDPDPKNLMSWLHQHYYKFCNEFNIDKAALYLENLTAVDITSLSSTQSSQFYENHSTLDLLQLHLAIESTVFSLYEDQSKFIKSSHKKTQTDSGNKYIKSSVESLTSSCNGELYSFTKPTAMTISKIADDHLVLLDSCTTTLVKTSSIRCDPYKVLVDYAPYLSQMSSNWDSMSTMMRSNLGYTSRHPIFDDESTVKVLKTLDKIEDRLDTDQEIRHEKLLEIIEEIDEFQKTLTR